MKKHKVPCKKFYRQRAHCNPLSDSYIRYPLNCSHVDWRVHYPHLPSEGCKTQVETINSVETKHTTNVTEEGRIDQDSPILQLNTNKYPIDYNQGPPKYATHAQVTILDVGCGYGGLLFELSKAFPDKLILGMEIRDKITNYVGEKIHSYRKNYPPQYKNISVIRTNAMKFLPNYIKKNQIEKLFFCFPDPHFKKQNWRRRTITIENLSLYYYLLKTGGLIYFITDVYTLYLWVKFCFSKYPSFQLLSPEECQDDICVQLIHGSSEESKRVRRNQQAMYFCVARKV
ncbi:methyltransferase, putative [Plasmodium knowlesi strain H]|uniref:tRNA (guanine-N(7)-)-methyltransferase n=3 Tax=Plasmodium knowlesi TaxID=5850 RepID=A0A5K1UXB7_PLAKH|nr:tRNA (guanine-N(7)-)-methyltransferase, putative [Plasmodium knowlesi strain H]OTN65161.1 tRNA (guanine-N(7)-)-methyltransferase [Plasmodium knowlesi]CAA9988300.1 tRNA (guanine-N(7)-)-methyltransferase, putative [Plasmodium knowlesi strain H]SBO20244.1 methyltransferase, putative [Plasmodium knowlesi strain H]SBO20298.1 methyltransferase, putative [Plasmodium knowlesi strain H]VVS77774.1 tRNA (guanine-N(7)-)-methyltransferase, putative [Plasmodium knowlesi strain H]|eukprot:XP_002259278.1 methyltransferase, putative [Plasmodium knowlesi strain H]